tara:strand:+ start:16325 stop:17344 length:1020 start_codon:yes stop_codon:yes gene_type:complete
MIKKIIIFLILFNSASFFSSEVNIYTSRHYDSDEILYKEFTKKTGIKINIISGNGSALLERLKSESDNTLADIFFTVDAGNLWKIQKEGFFQPIRSQKIKDQVPLNLRGPNNEWVAIAKRARVIFYNPQIISEQDIKGLSYQDLASEKWKGKIAIRSSNNIYNQSLVASMIVKYGIEFTEDWARKLVSNFSRKPQGNDRAQIIAVANQEADIAIANSYYYGLMLSGLKGEEQQAAAKKVRMFFPNQETEGTHINISGLGIIRTSKNVENAHKFIEFLLSDKLQQSIVSNSFEYPIAKNVEPHPLILEAGINFKEDTISVSEYGEYNAEAVRLMDRVGWK